MPQAPTIDMSFATNVRGGTLIGRSPTRTADWSYLILVPAKRVYFRLLPL
jgi:hypothetical protein